MDRQFEMFKKSRALLLQLIEGLTLEQLHTIPKGFNNHIAWNIAHLVVTQQLLLYKLSGLPCTIPEELIRKYRKGTKPPSEPFTEEEFKGVKKWLLNLPDTLQEDYKTGIFKDYKSYTTSTGYVLRSFEQAVAFNNVHEGIHIGAVMALKKLV